MSITPLDLEAGPKAPSPAAPATSPAARRRHLLRLGKLVLAAASVAAMIGVWALIVRAGWFSRAVLPSPLEVGEAGWEMAREGTLASDTLASLRRAAIGFAVGSLAAIAVGCLTGRSRLARIMLEPTLRLLSPVPTIALVPLAVLWFGLGEGSKVFLVALGVFFPVWIATHNGIATTPADYLKVGRCLGAGRTATLLRVILPEALPDIVAGLRVGIAISFILIVAAEMSGTTVGLGYRLQEAATFSQPDRLIFCLGMLGLLGALCDRALALGARRFISWSTDGAG
ncbi:MAG: ABC transporter permease [Actinobacteria bacterium]|nr:ABC transporter permease [Actinomycetota bacterium]